MRELRDIILATLCIIFATVVASAQQFSVQAPQRVYQGEKFYVTYRLTNAQGSGLKVPQINGCTLLHNSTSTRQSYQVSGNGQTSSQSSTDYTYYYRADQKGDYTIGAATIQANGKTLKTKPQTLKITDSPVAGAGGNTQPQSPPNRPVSIDDI